MSEHKIVLLTGSSGKLGTAIVHSNTRFTLLKPSSNELDITNPKKIKDYFNKYNFSAIIHCAAMARMGQCEKNPMDAIKVNIIGTANLVNATIMKGNIRFIHISSDGVYYCDRGNYKENDETIPYNIYGWTKLGSETAVRILKDYSILRTSFFEPDNIPFHNAGVDVYSSKLPINEFAKAILILVSSEQIYKVLNEIITLAKKDNGKFLDFWKNFGKVVHELTPINKLLIKKNKKNEKISLF